jgi:hypothetical protein
LFTLSTLILICLGYELFMKTVQPFIRSKSLLIFANLK